MDALDIMPDELTEADPGFVPDAHAPVLATPCTIIAITTITTPTVV